MAAYTIRTRVVQGQPFDWYSIVEKTVWHYANGGTWSEADDGVQVLTMGGSGTSGTLRFKSPQDGFFLVALGIDNYKPWSGIVVDLGPSDTGTAIHPTYYPSNGQPQRPDWSQDAHRETASSKGVRIKLDFDKQVDTTYWVTITVDGN